MNYKVTVQVENREEWTVNVEAPRVGLAKTRAIAEYMHVAEHAPLLGELVEYKVEEV